MAPGKKERAAVLLEGEEAMQAAHEIGEPLRAAGKRWEEETVGAAQCLCGGGNGATGDGILSESTGESLLAKSGDAYGRFLGRRIPEGAGRTRSAVPWPFMRDAGAMTGDLPFFREEWRDETVLHAI